MQLDGPIISTVPLCPLLMLFGTYFHSRHRTPIFKLRLPALCPAIEGRASANCTLGALEEISKAPIHHMQFAVTGKKFGLFHRRMYKTKMMMLLTIFFVEFSCFNLFLSISGE